MTYPAPPDLAPLMPMLSRFARHLSDSPDQAEDLAQETLLRVLAQAGQGKAIDTLRPYVLATMRNLHRQNLRNRVETCDWQDANLSEPGSAYRQIACAEVRAAITRLPGDQAELLLLLLQGETSPAEMAELTRQPLGTVMSRLARARKRLKTDLGLAPAASITSLYDSAAL